MDEFQLKEKIKQIITSLNASASKIQKMFHVGYSRASRLLDVLEENDCLVTDENLNRFYKLESYKLIEKLIIDNLFELKPVL